MKPADVQLVEQIQQATQVGSRLLCTLARHGKAMEREEPERAEFLLSAVRAHPLYKGGRLAMDMLEIEDLMLDGPVTVSSDIAELTQVLSASVRDFVELLRRSGSGARGGPMPAETLGGRPDPNGRDEGSHRPGSATVPPRVSFGPSHDAAATVHQSPARDDGPVSVQREIELNSSDYLYDYLVLGFLDVLGRTRLTQ